MTISTRQQFSLFTRQASLRSCAIKSKFGYKMISSSEKIDESHILIIKALTVTLALKTAKQPFRLTRWLMRMRHETKFGENGSAVQKISSRQHSLIFLSFAVTLTLNTTNHFVHKTLRLIINFHKTEFGCIRIGSSKDKVETVIFWSYQPSLWHWPCR